MVAASAESARKPVIQYRAARLLAGAVMMRLIRAFPATPSPAQPPGPVSIRLA